MPRLLAAGAAHLDQALGPISQEYSQGAPALIRVFWLKR